MLSWNGNYGHKSLRQDMRLGPTNLFVYRQEPGLAVCSLLLGYEINSTIWLMRHVQPMAQPGSALHHHSGSSCPLRGLARCTSITQQQPKHQPEIPPYSVWLRQAKRLDAHAVNNKTIASWLHNCFGCLWQSSGSGRGLQGGPYEKRPACWLFLDFFYFPSISEEFIAQKASTTADSTARSSLGLLDAFSLLNALHAQLTVLFITAIP